MHCDCDPSLDSIIDHTREFWPILSGVETLEPGVVIARHRHLHAHATLVMAGVMEQVGYAGRVIVQAGDILLEPTLGCHYYRVGAAGAELIRFRWPHNMSFGSVLSGCNIDEIARLVVTDLPSAILALREQLVSAAQIRPAEDWVDKVALRLRAGDTRVADIADEFGVRRETIARGFRLAYGVSPIKFRVELRWRDALLRTWFGDEPLCQIAADTGFADQAHMTRTISRGTGRSPAAWRRAVALSRQDIQSRSGEMVNAA
jgi:AraC-like DNA-binding protein